MQSQEEITKQAEIPRADLSKEFVAGGSLFSTGGTRTLPQANDDVLRELGADVYDCMARDPDVSSCLMLLVNMVLADGVQINVGVTEKDPKFKQANDVAEFCRFAVGKLKT